MSYPGFTRPDLCSIRTADKQDEISEAVRAGSALPPIQWAMISRPYP